MPVTAATFERLALEDEDGQWELVCGRPRRKPDMSYPHNEAGTALGFTIWSQLDQDRYRIRVNAGHAKRGDTNYFIPDVMALPYEDTVPFHESRALETYETPLPFVAEVWSPSTAEYDVDEKFPEYVRRGDLEIWRVHPYDKTITAWRRQPDGSYSETLHTSGAVPVESLPGVSVVLESLFR